MTVSPISPLPATAGRTTAVFGSYVLAGAPGATEVLRDRWVILEGDRIAAVSESRPASADLVLDRPGRFVLPGMMNLHNHCFSEAIARSHAEDGVSRRNDQSIVYTVLLPLSKTGAELLTPEERLAVARMGVVQLLLGGASSVMEPFRNTLPEMFDAAAELGIRFWGAPYLFSASDPKAGAEGVEYHSQSAAGTDNAADLRAWNALYDRWQGVDGGRIGLAMSPHATDTCDPDLLRAAAARARELGAPITIHLAQSAGEVATIGQRWQGRTPAEYLDWLGVLGPDLLAAHCVYSSAEDLALMRAREVTVMNCPRVFARTGKTAAFSRFEAAGVRTMVGTDGYNMDLLGELGAAAIVSKTSAGDARSASSPALLHAVTGAGAVALGRPDLGTITPGAKADLTVVDMSHPHLQPHYDPVRSLIALANRANIDSVIVDGRLLVDQGRLTLVDSAALTAAGAAAIHKIWDQPDARAAFAANG
ncbi:amidohydrolase family protein [Pseudodonghicola flavimaris]|uniref:Amidohydrolase family protein n=1 Tax=Pseudodonghicola flavimaris TaxID=3050036 RepID=A0ABT7F2Q6_9RHOB|nr:amidohydrolase family protein [Pseudodonghicola flavimaris]MDK3018870.1 amidohydrolase family protein [Pseudodonghicola flavimaris]